jgi:predicted regulator of Ras-like GTPase activity (Roadblock/LC7/MglB family)
LSQPYRQDLNWLVTDFTTRVEDVAHAIVVSADGVPLALSADIPGQASEQFSAIISGLASLMQGAARMFEGGAPTQAMVEMEDGILFVKTISDGSSLAVLAAPECDTRQISFEMTRLVGAVGDLLTPAARGTHDRPARAPGTASVTTASGMTAPGQPLPGRPMRR